MWYVKGMYGSTVAWWGAFNKEDAERLAKMVNGTVHHESELR